VPRVAMWHAILMATREELERANKRINELLAKYRPPFIIGERCTVTIAPHNSENMPREFGTFYAVILGPVGSGWRVRVDHPGTAWDGWILAANSSAVGKVVR
jgi:hypothetical protein